MTPCYTVVWVRESVPKTTWKNLDEVELEGVMNLFKRTDAKYHDTKHFVISKVDNPPLGWNC